jgi:hypothetical protein
MEAIRWLFCAEAYGKGAKPLFLRFNNKRVFYPNSLSIGLYSCPMKPSGDKQLSWDSPPHSVRELSVRLPKRESRPSRRPTDKTAVRFEERGGWCGNYWRKRLKVGRFGGAAALGQEQGVVPPATFLLRNVARF